MDFQVRHVYLITLFNLSVIPEALLQPLKPRECPVTSVPCSALSFNEIRLTSLLSLTYAPRCFELKETHEVAGPPLAFCFKADEFSAFYATLETLTSFFCV